MEPKLLWGLGLIGAALLLLLLEIFIPSMGVLFVTAIVVALAGVVTVPRQHYEEVSPGVGQPLGVDHAKTLYGGARVRLLADNAWGLDLSYRYLPDLKVHQGLAGLAIAL